MEIELKYLLRDPEEIDRIFGDPAIQRMKDETEVLPMHAVYFDTEDRKLARERMEILAYRNQINPHFLYNTLSCIRDMALFHDDDDIADITMALSDIFRYAVKGSNIVQRGAVYPEVRKDHGLPFHGKDPH